MDSSNLQETYLLDSELSLADFPRSEASEERPSSRNPMSSTFYPSIGGQYRFNGPSLFDIEYINPAMLEAPSPNIMGGFSNNYPFLSMQNTQNELSPYHPDWQSPVTEFEQQQQIFQSQQGVLEGAFPNAQDTSTHEDMSLDWSGAWQGGLETLNHIANRPTDSSAFSHQEHFG